MGGLGDPNESGARRLGKYELQGEIGCGGMGVVYRAWDPGLRRTVALKVLRTAGAGTPPPADDQQRFLREARVLAGLDHPNLVRIFEVDRAGDEFYLAMELVDGGSLRELLDAKRPAGAPTAEIVRVLADAARAVHAAHEHGVIHRDLKPGNILLKRETRGERVETIPVVADFGLARRLDHGTQLTQSGSAIGTPEYMSPEQVEGRRDLDRRCDVFALGCILYEAATGKRPFEADSPVSTMWAVLNHEPAAPRRLQPDVPIDLETVILRALEKDRDRRTASAAALADDLERVLRGEPVAARRVSTAARALRGLKRRSGTAVAACLALLVVGLGGTLVWQGRERHRAAVTERLDTARAHRAQGRAPEGRDAFRTLLALEPDHAEGRAGVAWAEAELARLEAERRAEHERLAAAEAQARAALEKSGRVQRVLARWVALADTLARMEGIFYDSNLSLAEKQARAADPWGRVESFLGETPDDPASRATARALAGWARSLAGFEDEGQQWMREAAELDPDLPYGPMMLAMVGLSEYLVLQPLPSASGGAQGLTFGPMPPATPDMAELEKTIRTRIDAAARATVWGEGFAEEFQGVLAAMRAFQDGRLGDAEAGLTKALGAAALQAFRRDLLFARAKARYPLRRFREGIADLEQVLETRPGQAEAWFQLAVLWGAESEDTLTRGEDSRPALQKSLALIDEALKRRPGYATAFNARGCALLHLGNLEAEALRDPRPILERAAADFTHAQGLEPELPEARVNRGVCRISQAEAEAVAGGDPLPFLERAIEDFDTALSADDGDLQARSNRGLALDSVAEARLLRGEPIDEVIERAMADFRAVAEADPAQAADAHKNLGLAWSRRARAAANAGGDARPLLEHAFAEFDESLRLAPQSAETWNARATVWWLRGDLEAERGEDGGESFRRGIADFGEVLARRPGFVGALSNRAALNCRLGEIHAGRGEDPATSWRAATEDLDEVVKRAPDQPLARMQRGGLAIKLAEIEEAAGIDSRPRLRGAIADLDAALAAGLDDADVRNDRAMAHWAMGSALLAHGEDPRASFGAALREFDLLLKHEPTRGLSWCDRAGVCLEAAEAEFQFGGDPKPSLDRALADLDEAEKLVPRDARPHAERGRVFSTWAALAEPRGEDPAPWCAKALAAYGRALEIGPDCWQARANRGLLLWQLDRPNEAEPDLVAALKEAPGHPDLEQALAELRAGRKQEEKK